MLHCTKYQEHRNLLIHEISSQIQETNKYDLNLRLLLTGYPIQSIHNRVQIIKLTLNFVVKQKNKCE